MPMFGPMHAARMVGKNKRGAQRSASFVSRDGERRQHDSDWQREKTERVERLKRLRSASLASERWAGDFLVSFPPNFIGKRWKLIFQAEHGRSAESTRGL